MKRLVPVLLLVVSCGAAPAPESTQAGPARCPATVTPDADRVVPVPAVPSADTVGRLVPEQAPSEALLCRYAPVSAAASAPLAGSVALTDGLDAVPSDLLLPGVDPGPGAGSCTDGDGAVVEAYLLRLTYADGVVWVSGLSGAACSRTSNGRFRSGDDVGDVLVASHAAGAWTVPPQVDADQRCVPERAGRAGQEFALLPPGATTLVMCRVAGDGVTRRTATSAQRAEVQDVLDEPVATRDAAPCATGPDVYELAATYPSGPAVQVSFRPACPADVDNGSLQAALEPEGRARLQALLEQAF